MVEVIYIIIIILIFVFLGRYFTSLIANKKSTSYKYDASRYSDTPQAILQKPQRVERNSRELAEAKLEERYALKNALLEKERGEEKSPEVILTQEATSEIDIIATENIVSTSSHEIESTEMKSHDEVDELVSETQNSSAPINAPIDGEKDDLKRIKGIGVKIEEKLNSIGYYHFDQIATWNEQDVEAVNSQLSFSGRIQRDDWIGQAKLLIKDKE